MELKKENKKEKVIFPENSSEVIGSILKKYGLGETAKEILEKWKKGEISNSEKLAGIVGEAARKKVSLDTIISWIKEDLNLPEDTARKIAKELNEKILSLVTTPEKKERPFVPEKRPFEEEKKPKPTAPTDIYREPIE